MKPTFDETLILRNLHQMKVSSRRPPCVHSAFHRRLESLKKHWGNKVSRCRENGNGNLEEPKPETENGNLEEPKPETETGSQKRKPETETETGNGNRKRKLETEIGIGTAPIQWPHQLAA